MDQELPQPCTTDKSVGCVGVAIDPEMLLEDKHDKFIKANEICLYQIFDRLPYLEFINLSIKYLGNIQSKFSKWFTQSLTISCSC